MSGNTPHGRKRQALGNRVAPPRFLIFLLLLTLGFLVCQRQLPGSGWRDSLVVAFDFAALCFLALLAPLLRGSEAEAMRRHAGENDANRLLVLVITSILTVVIMAALTGELAAAKDGQTFAVARLIVTLMLIWLFANSVYALHYAHEFYRQSEKGDRGGLDFPGTARPGYSDFIYFACTLGMTFQTSDVTITRPDLRRIVLLHCIAAFVFNIGVIAFTINVLGGH